MGEQNPPNDFVSKKELTELYSTFSQLSAHYSGLLNNHRILVFTVCTVLLAAAANIAFNKNPDSGFYLNASPTVQTIAPIALLLFTMMVNYSIHQMLIVIHGKYNLVEDNLISLEKELTMIDFGKKNRIFREGQTRFQRIVRYYGTVYVIYLACLALFIAVVFLSA